MYQVKFNILLTLSQTSDGNITISSDERKKLLEWILKYYQIHIHGFPEIKSLAVLQSIFD